MLFYCLCQVYMYIDFLYFSPSQCLFCTLPLKQLLLKDSITLFSITYSFVPTFHLFLFFCSDLFVLGSLQYANEYWYMLRERLMACVELHVCIGSTICLIDVSLYHTTLTRVQDLSIITSLYCI